jgi:hypothetical protein
MATKFPINTPLQLPAFIFTFLPKIQLLPISIESGAPNNTPDSNESFDENVEQINNQIKTDMNQIDNRED